MVGVGHRRVVDADVAAHPLAPLLAAVAALAGARPVHSQVRTRHLAQHQLVIVPRLVICLAYLLKTKILKLK